jgi:hypothetical protein
MLLKKFMSLFSNSNNQSINKKKNHTESSVKQKVDPSHIGDLGEYKIDVQLRQFSKENMYLNDILITNPKSKSGYAQIDHVLVTPYAIFVIETKNYKGSIRGKHNDLNWRVNGRFNMYNPVRQNRTHINAIKRVLADYKDVKFVSIISFTKRCELYIDQELRNIESDELVVSDIRLTEVIERKLRRLKNENSNSFLPESDVIHIFNIIGDNNITDPKIRAEHVYKVNKGKVM